MGPRPKTANYLKWFGFLDDEAQRRFLLWMFGGLLLRLLVMPFFCHADFLSEYRRVYMTIEAGVYFPQMTRLLVYAVELAFLTVSLPFLKNPESLFYFSDFSQSTAGLPDYLSFVTDPHVFRALLLLKIPYLLFDLGTAVLVFRMLNGNRRQFLALKLWLFNPVTLYAFYIFGRFESIPIFFLALTLRMVQTRRTWMSAVALGLALNCREINIIFVPLYFLAMLDFRIPWLRNAVRILPAVAIVAGLYGLPHAAARLFHLTPLFYGKTAFGTDRALHLLDFRHHWMLPFVFSYFLICLWLLENRSNRFYRTVTSCAAAMAAFFFFTGHSAHYVSWLMLFPVLLLYFDRDMLKPTVLLWFAWAALWMFSTDAGVFTLLLASPLSIRFSSVATLPQWYAEHWGDHTFMNLGHLVLILTNLYHACLAYLCYKFFAGPRP